jgi:tetratricopeptide (TPR) repeat protein
MLPRASSIVCIVLSIGAVAPRSLRAEPGTAPATIDKRKAAKAYVDAGLAAEEQGDYEAAIQLYRKAHDLIPHPVVLFNLAQAHRLAGQRAEALDLYRRYLAAKPRGDLAMQAKRWVDELEAAIARETADAETKLAEQRGQEASRAAAEEARTPPSEPAPPPAPLHPDSTPAPAEREGAVRSSGSPGRGWRIAGISAAGIGTVTIATGAVFGLRAKGISDDLSTPDTRYDPEREADGEAAERTMFVLYGVGGALVIGGVLAYLLNRPGDEPLTVGAMLDGQNAGVSLGSRF